MPAQIVVLSRAEAREGLVALETANDLDAAEVMATLVAAYVEPGDELSLELTDAQRRALESALAKREAKVRAERESCLRRGDRTAAALYRTLAERAAAVRARLASGPLALIA
jgi:hypothetical protein